MLSDCQVLLLFVKQQFSAGNLFCPWENCVDGLRRESRTCLQSSRANLFTKLPSRQLTVGMGYNKNTTSQNFTGTAQFTAYHDRPPLPTRRTVVTKDKQILQLLRTSEACPQPRRPGCLKHHWTLEQYRTMNFLVGYRLMWGWQSDAERRVGKLFENVNFIRTQSVARFTHTMHQ